MNLSALLDELRRSLGDDAVFADRIHRRAYEADAYAFDAVPPGAVVLPRSSEEAGRVVDACLRHGVPWAPRGAGTGLSGGCLSAGGVQIGTARLRRILDVDPLDRLARVEAGVVNLELNERLAPHGLCFAPDPSSQAASTVGGNFAENAGGPHTLKVGVTRPHVRQLRMISPEGDRLVLDADGCLEPDLLALQCGAEGTLGLVTELTLSLEAVAPARQTLLVVFDSAGGAAHAVAEVIARGVVPAAMEMIDRVMLRAVEEAFHFGFPVDAGAVLVMEMQGSETSAAEETRTVRSICEKAGAREIRQAADEEERARLWKARKHAFGAVGRLAPRYATQDGVVPRAAVPEIVSHIAEVARRRELTIGVVLHAGDGNIHPAILYDERDPEMVERALAAAGDILDRCIELGGSPTGEHGVGLEKRDFLGRMLGPVELEAMHAVRAAHDPRSLSNPDKILPTGGGCGEARRPLAVSS